MASPNKKHWDRVVSICVGLMLVMGLVPALALALTPNVVDDVQAFDEGQTIPEDGIHLTADKPVLTITTRDETAIYNGALQGESDTVYDDDIESIVIVDGLQGNDELGSIQIFYQGCDADRYDIEVSGATVMNGSSDVTDTYQINYVYGTFTITKAQLTITARPKTYDYTGEPHGPAGTYTSDFDTYVKVEGLVGGDTLTSITLSGSQTNANVYAGEIEPSKASVAFAHDTEMTTEHNYDVKYVPADLTIWGPPVEENVTLTTADVVTTYDGASHAAGTATTTDKQGNEVTVEYQMSDGTWTEDPSNVTATNVEDSLTVNVRAWAPCYMGALADEQLLTIAPRPVTVTSADGSWTYDGTTHTKPGVTVSGDGFVAGEVSDVTATGSVTNVQEGTVANTIAIAGPAFKDSNYMITKNEGKLSIEPAKATITVANASKAEGEADPPFKGTIKGLVSENDLGEVTYKRTNNDEAPGTYKGVLTAQYAQNDNYDVTVKNGDFTITKGSSKNTLPKTGDPLSGTPLSLPALFLAGASLASLGFALKMNRGCSHLVRQPRQ